MLVTHIQTDMWSLMFLMPSELIVHWLEETQIYCFGYLRKLYFIINFKQENLFTLVSK